MKKLNKKGFTLTEVLVAVSIVAVLSAVSVPSYTRMRILARTAEAKTNLGQLYITEKSFFIQWGCYISDLITIGFKPEGELLYNVGFLQETVTISECSNYNGPPIDGTRNNLSGLCGTTMGSGTLKNCAFIYKGNTLTPPAIPTNTQTDPTKPNNGSKLAISGPALTFTAAAIVNVKKPLDTDTTPVGKNIWTINNFKRITEIQDIDGAIIPY